MAVQFTNERIKAALVECKGMVYLAAKRVGCNPETIYARARVSPEIRDTIHCERGKVIDTAEMKLFNAIEKGEPWAIQMALKTIGKDRGYVERSELTGADGQALAFLTSAQETGLLGEPHHVNGDGRIPG